MRSRNNLAGAYRSVGRLEETITGYEAVLTDCERVLGLAPTVEVLRRAVRLTPEPLAGHLLGACALGAYAADRPAGAGHGPGRG